MQDEDKIYGLIVQAQAMQKAALEFQETAEALLKSVPTGVPDVVRDAIRDTAKEIIKETIKDASMDLRRASKEAAAASEELRSILRWAWPIHVFCLVLAAVVVMAIIYFVFPSR